MWLLEFAINANRFGDAWRRVARDLVGGAGELPTAVLGGRRQIRAPDKAEQEDCFHVGFVTCWNQ